jgi:AcrR family transcriptional regulator
LSPTRVTSRRRATRARVIEAAGPLFIEHGYLNATMEMLASEADVSVQTLYLAFGSKVGILRAAQDVAVVGDDEDVPALERPWVEAVRLEPDGPTALRLLVENVGMTYQRVSPLFEVIRAAASDPDVAELEADLRQQRHTLFTQVASTLRDKDGFDRNVTETVAADLLYAILGADLYSTLVVNRGWSVEAWHDLVDGILQPKFFPGRRGHAPRVATDANVEAGAILGVLRLGVGA